MARSLPPLRRTDVGLVVGKVHMDLVSVIVPLYNASPYVEQLQQQIKAQTYPHIEWVLVDDCSPDDTVTRLQTLKANLPDHNIILARNEHNLTAGLTRNYGLELSSGKFVFFMDADDRLDPDMIARLHHEIEAQQADFVYFGHRRVHANASDFRSEKAAKPLFIRNLKQQRLWGLTQMELTPWSKFVRREFLDQHHITFPPIYSGQDQCWTVQLVLYARKIAVVAEPLYTYVEYQTSLSHSSKSPFSLFAILDFDLQTLQESALRDEALVQALESRFFTLFVHHWRNLPAESRPRFAQLGLDFFARHHWALQQPPASFSERYPLYKLLPRQLPVAIALKLKYKRYKQQRSVLALLRQYAVEQYAQSQA